VDGSNPISGGGMTGPVLKILGVLALVCLNGFFVAAEFAFVKLRGTQLDPLILKGNRRARVARGLVNHLEACISATQVGITLCGVITGALTRPAFQALLLPVFNALGVNSPSARTTIEFLIGFLVSTFLLIVIGELVPKSLAIRKTLPTALWVAQPLAWFYRLAFPFIWFLNHSAQWFLGRLGIQPLKEGDQPHSEEELRLLVAGGSNAGTRERFARSIILNAFDLRHRIAREVMRPRREMVALDTQAPLAECVEIAERTRYSRFPVCEGGDLDKTLGVVHIKDLFSHRLSTQKLADRRASFRKIVYVPETARLDRVLSLLLDRRLHFAIVVDEYGGTLGLLTLENILEELVGQIQDEFDQEKPPVVNVGPDTWEIEGSTPLHELADLVGEEIREEDVTTVSGLVTHRLGGFPHDGDTVQLGPWELRVLATDNLRVTKLRLAKIPTPPETLTIS
jgi:CBS domain containing-hemolysin-like protein